LFLLMARGQCGRVEPGHVFEIGIGCSACFLGQEGRDVTEAATLWQSASMAGIAYSPSFPRRYIEPNRHMIKLQYK
jgi:hypothetical protein